MDLVRTDSGNRSAAIVALALASLLAALALSATAAPKASAATCPSFRVLHNDRIGAAVLPATAVPIPPPDGWRRLEVTGLGPRAVGLATSRRIRLTAPARAVIDGVRRVIAEAGPDRPGVRVLETGANDV